MKNSLSLILFLIFLQSCKETPSIQTTSESVSVNKNAKQPCNPDAYNGLGTFDSDGKFTYLISLPEETTSNKYTFKLFNINDETIFIHLDNKSPLELSNPGQNVYTLVDTLPKYGTSSSYRPNYKVFLWHNDAIVNSAEQAERIMNPTDSLVAPKKVGMGILSLK
ncbi:hypothetical protein [Flavobacterium soli]|uniref:hypothetical protein n=1 Tax=Flavobacterium soli TaxID=344881 RepID=UPI00040FDDAC|nr:hypothetical protein [Flavobacterium soli]